MKYLSFLLFALTVFLFGACAPQPRQATFNEAAFTRYAGTGTATITGTAFAVKKDKSKIYANGFTIKCLPDNDYTDEIVRRHYWNRVKLEAEDSRMAKYVRKTQADDDGNFAFRHLPPGDYIVSFHADWNEPFDTTDASGASVTVAQNNNQWVFKRVTVSAGQTLVINDWNQGHGNVFQP